MGLGFRVWALKPLLEPKGVVPWHPSSRWKRLRTHRPQPPGARDGPGFGAEGFGNVQGPSSPKALHIQNPYTPHQLQKTFFNPHCGNSYT